jgi:hypothetical protein
LGDFHHFTGRPDRHDRELLQLHEHLRGLRRLDYDI